MIKSFLIHGHVSQILLLSTLVPIVKDRLKNICSSKNYRSIAISSLILKTLDWTIILLFGTTLGLEDLQFAYKAKCSTFMCSWLVLETVDYFLRNNTEVFCCTMDMTKAFDLVKFSVLFAKLVEKKLPLIFIRLLLYMYLNQSANVRWNGELSKHFTITNGVKQGMVLSALLYCLYCSQLMVNLKEKKTGCWINGDYLGIHSYSDDNLLLSPSLEGLQEMLNTCSDYAKEHLSLIHI